MAMIPSGLTNATSDVPRIDVPPGFEDLATAYFQKRKDDLPLLLQLMRDRGFSELRVLGHNMKGTGSSYGFAGLSLLGAQIESYAEENNGPAISERLAALAQYIQECEPAVLELDR